MAFEPNKETSLVPNSPIDRQFTEVLATNLPLYQRGLFSPQEFLRTLTQDFGQATAEVITPTSRGEYPDENTLTVKRIPGIGSPAFIEVQDPHFSKNSEYPAVVLAANAKRLYPALVYKISRQSQIHLLVKAKGPDYEDGKAVANWFEIAKVK